MTLKSAIFSIFLFIILQAGSLQAHDVWLEASPFYAKPKQSIDISLYVGSDMVGEELPNLLDKYSDFSYFSAEGRQDVDGEIAGIPAGLVTAKQRGTYVVGYRSLGSYVELDATKFTHYLKEEGLDKIIDLRQQLGQQNDVGKEQFSRAVKTLLQVGDNQEHDFSSETFGYALELTAEKNPYQLNIGDALAVCLTYEGKPFKNKLVTAFTKEQPQNKQKVRTDEKGRAIITLDRSGIWLIKAVEMLPVEGENYDWESIWASLTFQLK